jgi:hypothetical protein
MSRYDKSAEFMAMHRVSWNMLHRMWSMSVGTPGYNKKYWMNLERNLYGDKY